MSTPSSTAWIGGTRASQRARWRAARRGGTAVTAVALTLLLGACSGPAPGVAADVAGERFVTLLLARLDPVNRTLLYTSAGHMPIYILDLLANRYGGSSALGKRVTRLVDTRRIWIVFMPRSNMVLVR